MTLRTNCVIISDIHYHNWSLFSEILPNGVNSRLQELLDATEEAALKAVELHIPLIIAGDVFHTRGSIIPSVFNPVFKLFKRLCSEKNLLVYAIPGNHDIEHDEVSKLGNSFQSLENIDGFNIISIPSVLGNFVFIPWCKDHKDVFKHMENLVSDVSQRKHKIVICHTPLNGVIKGLPDNGANASQFMEMGYEHVFCGHYHHGKSFSPHDCFLSNVTDYKVSSIGSLAHHSWGDVNNTVGYIVYKDYQINRHGNSTTKFVSLDVSGCNDDFSVDLAYLLSSSIDSSVTPVTPSKVNLCFVGKCELDLKALSILSRPFINNWVNRCAIEVKNHDRGLTLSSADTIQTNMEKYISANFTKNSNLSAITSKIYKIYEENLNNDT
jgi:DNA repair exonuclease SbcCD nuclease subunit